MSEQTASNAPDIKAFFDHDSNTVSYVVADPATKKLRLLIRFWILIMRQAPSATTMPTR